MIKASKLVDRRKHRFIAALSVFAVVMGWAGFAAAAGDITGIWMIKPEYIGNRTGLVGKPDFTPEVLAMQAKRAELTKKGYVRTMGNMLCLPTGGPSLFTVRSPFEVMAGFGRISFIFETEGSNQPRTVYLNEKEHGPNIYPSFNGHSIGHWEGDTLVVDTIGFNGRGQVTGGIPKSTQTHLVERFTKSAGGKVLTAVITVEDPIALKKPFTATLKFDRFPDTEERFEVWCEPDLEAFKTLNLEELKDGDPEVARLLNPDLRPTDPALKIAGAANSNPPVATGRAAGSNSMKPKQLALLAATALALAGSAAAPAMAHHSFAMFALDKVVTVNGVVTDYRFQMPHVWLYMTLPASDGVAAGDWEFEAHSPNLVARKGWNINTLKPGDKLTVLMHPMRDGTKAGSVINVILPNGKTLWNAETLNQP